jgi:hypothetical protein
MPSLALLLLTAGLATAQHDHPLPSSPPGKLTLAVDSKEASPKQEIDIPITVKGANNLGALELVLTYDPAILEAKSADRGALLSNSLLEYYANESGRLAVTLVSQDGVTGDGVVATAHFLVKGQAGQKCALRLENVRAWDGKTHLDFLVTTTAGEFTVKGFPLPWWLIAAIGAAVLLLLVLLLLLRMTRRPSPPAPPPVVARGR